MKEKQLNGKKLCKKKYCRKQLAITIIIKHPIGGASLETINIYNDWLTFQHKTGKFNEI
jgi:hypothetical protein